jgi:hypothetical protein
MPVSVSPFFQFQKKMKNNQKKKFFFHFKIKEKKIHFFLNTKRNKIVNKQK